MNMLLHKNKAEIKPLMSSKKTKPTVQPKLTINAPGDIYEQEADAMADKVMRMSANETIQQPKPNTGLIGRSVQRKCANCEDERKKPIMRKAQGGETGIQVSSSFASSLNASRGGGSPLPQGTRDFMGNAFSTDFSSVRVHTNERAAELSSGINAKAFTYGNNIYFKTGYYNPNSVKGKHLLAHELTHTLQQQSNIQRSANTCTFGEIRQWAIVSQRDHSAPAGLADAKASIGAACSRGQPCSCHGLRANAAPGDRAAWRNIRAASGGTDHSNNGNFMCVGHQGCWFVHQCRPVYQPGEARPPLRERTTNLQPVGRVSIRGNTVYFYRDRRNGNCPP